MRTALLLAGQMRTYDHPKVIEYQNKLIDRYNCDVFISTWNNRGISVWSEYAIKNAWESQYKMKNEQIVPENMHIFKNVKSFVITDYNAFLSDCPEHIKNNLLDSSDNLMNTKLTSYPQFYKYYSVCKLKLDYEEKHKFIYDIVIISRPDFLQVHNDLDEYFIDLNNVVYHINTGGSYYPNRFYNMLFLSNSKTIDKICEVWDNYFMVAKSNINNGLNIYDSCRMLYIWCLQNNIEIRTFNKVFGDILRLENYSDFESLESMYR